MECDILTLRRQGVTMLVDRGRKYGVCLIPELSHFFIYFYRQGSRNRYKKLFSEIPNRCIFFKAIGRLWYLYDNFIFRRLYLLLVPLRDLIKICILQTQLDEWKYSLWYRDSLQLKVQLPKKPNMICILVQLDCWNCTYMNHDWHFSIKVGIIVPLLCISIQKSWNDYSRIIFKHVS